MAQMTMAELLAKNNSKQISVVRGQEVEGTIISIFTDEIILDLGTKAEGVLKKQELSPTQIANLKVGDKLSLHVISAENESGQVFLGTQKVTNRSANSAKFARFELAQRNNQTLVGKGQEVNKGGLVVEVSGMRGFLPSSQVSLSQAGNLDDLVGKEVRVTVIEVDAAQNRLIFSQNAQVSDELKQKLEKLEVGSQVNGEITAVLSFGVVVKTEDGIDGLVHISELSWEKIEDPNTLFKVGDKVEAKILSVDLNTGKVNLSLKQLNDDPFSKIAEKFQPDDVVKGVVSKVTPQGVSVTLADNIEGFIPATKMDDEYEVGESVSCMVDSVDSQKRRINLAPFITSTKDLIYK